MVFIFIGYLLFQKKQGQGIAKEILKSLDDYAKQNEKPTTLCTVRMTVPKNIKCYCSIGYRYKPNGIKIKVVSMEKQLL